MKNNSLRALPYAQAPALMKRLQSVPGVAAKCLQFTILTAARTKESIGAAWSEFDLERAVWPKCKVQIWTHKIKGSTESDFYFAAKADRAFRALDNS